ASLFAARQANEKRCTKSAGKHGRRGRRGTRNIPESTKEHQDFSRAIKLCDVDVSDPDKHLLRRAAQPDAEEGSRERRDGGIAIAGTARAGCPSFAEIGTATRNGEVDGPSTTRFFAL